MFPRVEQHDYNWTDNLDKIGKLPKRDESFVAMVHADGNGMGKRILLLSEIFEHHFPKQPRAYIEAIRALSLSFRKTAKDALVKMVNDLVNTLDQRKQAGEILYHIARSKDGSPYPCFPLRPIVFGGDDVTFVTAGAWGVALAHRYLHYLESGKDIPGFENLLPKCLPSGFDTQKINDALAVAEAQKVSVKDSKPYACAGVSIVKTHYPISRAYENSEALAKSAKQMVLAYKSDKGASAIDWHFTTTGLAGSLADIRKREYVSTELMPEKIVEAMGERMYPLPMRPIMLSDEYTWRNWNNFVMVFDKFKDEWESSRNKMMALREVVREGPTATAEFEAIEHMRESLPKLDGTTITNQF